MASLTWNASPSPLDMPPMIRLSVQSGSTRLNISRIWPLDEPFRALEVSPTYTTKMLVPWRSASAIA